MNFQELNPLVKARAKSGHHEKSAIKSVSVFLEMACCQFGSL